jgi:release factor glutamine methyltransferase
LIEHFCGVNPSRLPFLGERELDSEELETALRRRESGEPLQYIIGEWSFMNEVYEVSPSVLIPRQDTETLVEWAVKNIPRGGRFADLCTGSGCVAISTLAARSDLTCLAVEKYPDALEVAKKNAVKNGVADRVDFVCADVLRGDSLQGSFDVIVSNPPYISVEEYGTLAREIFFEPSHALTDGADGLTFYRTIFDIYPGKLGSNGKMALEIGSGQAEDVIRIAAFAGMSAEIIKDLSGNDRVVVCKML